MKKKPTYKEPRKKLVAEDDEYLTFRATGKKSEKRDDFTSIRNQRIRNLWLEIKAALGSLEWGCSFAPGLLGVADKEFIHVASGGIDVFEYMTKHGPLPITAFKQACFDLPQLHKKKIYLRDIKNENFIVKAFEKDAEGKKVKIQPHRLSVKFIDLDDAFTPTFGKPDNPINTPVTCTSNLLKRRITATPEALRSADYYAMIICMFEAVHKNAFNAELVPPEDSRRLIYNTGLLADAPDYTKGLFHEFLEKNVNPDYKNMVSNFMKNPVKYPIPMNVDLSMLFKW